MRVAAKKVGAAAVLDWNERLAKRLTFVDRFDKKYTMYRREGDNIWVPRGLTTDAEYIDYDEGIDIDVEDNFKPRFEDQADVVAQACALLDKGEDFILQAATGYGKTYLGAKMISHVKKRTLVITTKEDIIGQWAAAVHSCCGIPMKEIGVWRGDSVPMPKHKVVIGLVQSVRKGPDRYGKVAYKGFGMVICDEVHRMGAEHFSEAMWWLPAWHRVGLSATPDRKDGRKQVFVSHIGPVMVEAQQDAMKFKVIVQQSGWKVPMVHWYGTYQKMPHSPGRTMGLDKNMGSDKVRNRIITQFVRAAVVKGRVIIVFSSRIKHLQVLYAAFREAGIQSSKVGFYVGLENYKGSRVEKQRQREAAKIRQVLLATYSMASEATDLPVLNTCVLATPRSDVRQIVGRIRREYPDKPMPVVFDLVDTDSRVLKAYWGKRLKWYKSIGAEVVYK